MEGGRARDGKAPDRKLPCVRDLQIVRDLRKQGCLAPELTFPWLSPCGGSRMFLLPCSPSHGGEPARSGPGGAKE
jgi:hypothetical protein